MRYTESQITEAYENETLFVRCLRNVQDGEGIYNIAGNEYAVMGEDEENECWYIATELDDEGIVIQVKYDDKDFELFIKETDLYSDMD